MEATEERPKIIFLNRDRELIAKELKDIRILTTFVRVYCRKNHPASDKKKLEINNSQIKSILKDKDLFCSDCSELLTYGVSRRLRCPKDPKPYCKNCDTHCYRPGYRQTMRQVMRFSGQYFIKRGRIDMLWHYYF